ncbi:MAG: NADH-quinone oxidoreductase subunit L [Aeromicrobium sp.]|uniref:NADH-quinone oxidoreductase subunit L n=1 Tax=Aeromicrobium sp. TaxID=1871063 RepID=UPI0039E4DBF5
MILWPLIAAPALGAALLLTWGKESDRFGHLIATAASAVSFGWGVWLFVGLLSRDAHDRTVSEALFTWFSTGEFHVEMSFVYDPLAAVFVLLITGVGTLIHVYSIGYMAHDERRRRFFAFLNLFVAAMLVLVLAGDYLVLFLGWEGVGLASYLLIGFWQHKSSAAAAAQKAFVVNRVGDVGMALAIMLMFAEFGTTEIAAVADSVPGTAATTITALGLLLLLGACGKSAQVPLQSWLLDAMEGPTPVSALIHAATMVTAGVYLVVRSHAIFDASPAARTAVVIVGLVTLLAGAIIGCAKDDIKKALAGSTMSQIGYMMLAAGLGPAGYAFAIFHLLTHGFFKANMFLGAGSVMHAMGDDVDMRHYGALARALPVTFATFGLGYLAIIGFPGFSGFFSKDRIIEAALAHDVWIGLATVLGAGVTAFYMTRLMAMTFAGRRRWREQVHPHESPATMTVPLVVLAAASVLGGALLLGDWITDWLRPVVGHPAHREGHHDVVIAGSAWSPLAVSGLVTGVVALGVLTAWLTYGRREVADTAPEKVSILTRAARADLYGDAINAWVVVRPVTALARGIARFDRAGLHGAITGVAGLIGEGAAGMRTWQNGFVRSYALTILAGALVVALSLLVVIWR